MAVGNVIRAVLENLKMAVFLVRKKRQGAQLIDKSASDAYTAGASGAGTVDRPVSTKEPFDDPDWIFEFKCKGFLALLYLERERSCRFVSRNGNTLSRFDALSAT